MKKNAARLYDTIRQKSGLGDGDREVLDEVFVNLFLQRFKTKTRKEIRKMIAELTPLKETRVGQELYEEGIEKGIEKGIEEGERTMALRLLGRKFPTIAERARPMVEALSGPDLLAFGEELMFFGSGEDCLGWLERRR